MARSLTMCMQCCGTSVMYVWLWLRRVQTLAERTRRSRKLPGWMPVRDFLLPITCLARSEGLAPMRGVAPGVRGAAHQAVLSCAAMCQAAHAAGVDAEGMWTLLT